MSTLRNPVGPKSKNVYLRRRILVLAGVIAVAAAIVLIIVKPGASSGAPGSAEVKVPDDLAEIAQQDTQKDQTELPQCAAGQLSVAPVTDRESYAPGEQPMLSMSISNTGAQKCSADLGTAGMVYEISSGNDLVWKASDCQKNPDQRPVILEPGQTLETEPMAWDRTRSSAETCEIEREPVGADGASYHLRVAVAGVQGVGTAQFLLY